MEGRQLTLVVNNPLATFQSVETQHPTSEVQPSPPRVNSKRQKASPERTNAEGWVERFCQRHQNWVLKCFFGYNDAIRDGREVNCMVCVQRSVRDHHAQPRGIRGLSGI